MVTEVAELEWAAGFFDGEGYIGITTHGLHRVDKQLRVMVSQSYDPVTLYRFQKAVGCGIVNGPYLNRGSPMWQFRANSYDDVLTMISKLWSYLSPPKRRQTLLAIMSRIENRKLTHKDILNTLDYLPE
jgi:hypothetical protein